MSAFAKRILFIENDEHVLKAVTLRLRLEGYQVIAATSYAAASQAISQEIYHLALIDIRLEDDRKEGDKSGFALAKLLPSHIPFIFHTAHDTRENILEAIRTLQPADVIAKDDPNAPELLIKRLADLFTHKIRFNFALKITGAQPEQIAASIEMPSDLAGPTPTGDDVIALLGNLFFEAHSVHLTPLVPPESAPTLSQSGSALFRVQAERAEGRAVPVVLKVGAKDEITDEANHYRDIRPFLGGTRVAQLEGEAYSRPIGALVYTLVGAHDWQSIRTLSEVIVSMEAPAITAILERFLRQTFRELYQDARHDSVDLSNHYTQRLNLTPQKLNTAVTEIFPSATSDPTLKFRGLHHSIVNPILWSLPKGDFRTFGFAQVRTCLTHGDLHCRNVLVDNEGNCWLVDFARSGRSHLLRDIAELETDLKFQVFPAILLEEREQVERALLAQGHWGDLLPDQPFTGATAKIYTLVKNLRRIAAELTPADVTLQEYLEALFWHTLNMVRLKALPPEQKKHALFSSALLATQLAGE